MGDWAGCQPAATVSVDVYHPKLFLATFCHFRTHMLTNVFVFVAALSLCFAIFLFYLPGVLGAPSTTVEKPNVSVRVCACECVCVHWMTQ